MSISQGLEDLSSKLAAAESASKTASDDAKQARAQQQQSAVDIVKFLVETPPVDSVTGVAHGDYVLRRLMLDEGVLKGTVSKILTVVNGIKGGYIALSDVKSLNGSYTAVKQALKPSTAPATSPAPAPAPAPASAPAEPTPEEAMKIIIKSIRNAGDKSEEAVFQAASEWIRRITEEISEVTRAVSLGEETEYDAEPGTVTIESVMDEAARMYTAQVL